MDNEVSRQDPGGGNREARRRATRIWRQAYEEQLAGNLERAVQLYEASIEIMPTAEAHTFLGWTYSFQGRYHDAIAECHRAIEIDPEFGNPWNDIGAYLIELDRVEESIPYFERALRAQRYEARHFPHVNLGRVYTKLGRWHDAVHEYEQALELDPDHEQARSARAELLGRLN